MLVFEDFIQQGPECLSSLPVYLSCAETTFSMLCKTSCSKRKPTQPRDTAVSRILTIKMITTVKPRLATTFIKTSPAFNGQYFVIPKCLL